MKTRGPATPQASPRRAPRPPLTGAKFYRTAVPLTLLILALVMLVLLVVAASMLFGLVSFPGR